METNTQINSQSLPFKFTGKGFEYFKIWIVNICLSVLTLGIYSAWAKVRTKTYFYGNTLLGESGFSYLAEPKSILKGRAISVILLVVYWLAWQYFPEMGILLLAIGCLLFPFFIVSTMAFRMRNSAYRNIRFHFIKDLKASYIVFMLPLGLLVLFTWLLYTAVDSFGILEQMVVDGEQEGEFLQKEDFIFSAFLIGGPPIIPWLDYLRTRFIVDHTKYGKTKATFNSSSWQFYKLYLITGLVYLAVFIVGGAMAYGIFKSWLDQGNSSNEGGGIMNFIPIGVVISYAILIFISGIWKAMRTNTINNKIKIGENQLFSHLKGAQVGWIYLSNTIAIVCSLGLLIPWAKVRMAKYIASCTELQINDLESIRAVEPEQGNAFGEEMNEVFDMDIGF